MLHIHLRAQACRGSKAKAGECYSENSPHGNNVIV
jgi:hypothetical protein